MKKRELVKVVASNDSAALERRPYIDEHIFKCLLDLLGPPKPLKCT